MATQIILIASPFFFLLIFIELWVNYKKGREVYRLNDAITSLSLGVISQSQKLIIFSLASLVYAWFSDTIVTWQWNSHSAFTWVFAFIFYDFLYYWYHRFSHQINFLWAGHVVHHQSEEYNLTTALRQTSSSVGAWLFYIPSFIIGIPAEVFFVCGALNLIYQFWVHTRLVGRLGWMESVLVTPSHHRVHHGQNQIYIDKNHGGVFIIWDRLFGTFQRELDDVKVIYGVRRALGSFNPLWANVHTWYSLFSDAIKCERWFDKLKIWFMPTGWRPADVEHKYPIQKRIPEELVKFDPPVRRIIKVYVLVQYVIGLMLGVLFIQFQNELSFEIKLLVWLVISAPLIGCGLLLETKSYAAEFEFSRLFASATPVIYFSPLGLLYTTTAVVGYLLVSMSLLILIVRGKKSIEYVNN